MFSRVRAGFRAFWSSFGFLRAHKLLSQALLPALVGLSVALVLLVVVIFVSRAVSDALFAQMERLHELPEAVHVAVRLIFIAAGIMAIIAAYRPLSSLLVLPFIGPLLGKVEAVLIGHEIKTTLSQDFKNALIGGWLGVKASAGALGAFVLTLPLGPLEAPVMFLVDSYVLGRSAFDFVFEKETETADERKALTRQFRPEILGVGIGFALFLFVPVIGIAVAPVLAVVAAARLRYGKA